MNKSPDALKIVSAGNDRTLKLNEVALSSILLHPKVRNRRVVVISVAGAFRKGKSFLLDFFLRYLHSEEKTEWMGSADEPLLGFPWRGGTDRMTTGILMWSEPFEIRLPCDEIVAVLLMDTQGIFDSQSTFTECAKLFALTTLVSSVLIYNLTGNIQEDDLQHLQFFTEYGQLVKKRGYSWRKPFQNLTLLVRDWPNAYEYNYGLIGGAEVLNKKLKVNSSQPGELQQLRTDLKSSFSNINCYLMPHPGLKVQNNPKFTGNLSAIEEDFQIHVKAFVESLLKPEKLVVKEINGSPVTGRDLMEYFRATAEANNLAAFGNAKDFYIQEMDEICDDDKPYLSEAQLMFQHELCKEGAMDEFKMTPKMGKTNEEETYVWRLDQELDDLFKFYLMKNTTKFENQKKIIRGAVGGAVAGVAAGAAAGAAVAVVGIPAAAAAVMGVIRLLK